MKKFDNLIHETINVQDIQELESAADLFQFGIEKGYYNRLQTIEFNKQYWNTKNRLITESITDCIKDINILDLTSIVAKAPLTTRENRNELIAYVNRIKKNLRGKQRLA